MRPHRIGPSGRSTGGLASLALALLVAGPLAGPSAAQQGLDRAEWDFLREVVALLRDADVAGLAGRTDFERRLAEGVARGTARSGWNDLDELGQHLEIQQTTEDWVMDDWAYLQGATIAHARRLDDPDAGRGPVPDRAIFLVVLKSASTRALRELLVTTTADRALLDLRFGVPFQGELDPGREPEVRPEPLPGSEAARVSWPEDMDSLERSEAVDLVDQLLATEERGDRERVVEYLHRNPRAGVTALVARLVELEDAPEPDAERQSWIVKALTTITGRSSRFSPVPRWEEDRGLWRAANRAEVAAWARWHDRHGARFAAAAVPDPAEPTFGERGGASGAAHLARPPSGPDGDAVPDERSPRDAGAARPGDPGPLPERGTVPAGIEQPAQTTPEREEREAPKPVLREIARPVEDLPPVPSARDLEILWGDERRLVADLADQIPPGVRAVLDGWAPVVEEFGMTVVLSGNPDHLVLGLTDEDVLVEAAKVLDAAWEVLHPIVPMVSGRRARPTLALLFDNDARKVEVWRPLIDTLVSRRVVTAEAGQALSAEPGGVTARHYPLFLQPTWDMAGNAVAGDDEFRLRNELAHKLAQCLLTQRCGSQPAALRWALGHLVENRLFASVYQFNRSGFVASGDHFDWPTRARQVLERRSARRTFSLPDRVLAGDQQADSLDNAMLAWAVIETLASDHANDLAALFQDMAEIHDAQDPYGLSSTYRGDPEETLEALTHRLGVLTLDDIVSHLRTR